MKKIVFIIISILFITGCNIDDDYGNTYKIELSKEPYHICGREIYFSNDADGNELNMNRIIEIIKDSCEVEKIDYTKEEIFDILDDDDLTKEDILWRLKDIYQSLEK